MKYILRMGQGYVVSPALTFGIPRFTFNPQEALELPEIVARALQRESDLPLIMEDARAERPEPGFLGRRGIKTQTLEEMIAAKGASRRAYDALHPPAPRKAKKKSQDWSEYMDIIRD